MRLGIVGGGRAAWFFAEGWMRAGGELIGFELRNESKSVVPSLLNRPVLDIRSLAQQSDILLVAVRDKALPEVATKLRSSIPADSVVFHCSGAVPADIFTGFTKRFSLHPLRALPVAGARAEGPTLFAFEGVDEMEAVAREVSAKLGGQMVRVTSDAKTTYHAAAAMAANYAALLANEALELFAIAGIDRTTARNAVANVAISAIDTWRNGAGRGAFTGPIVRGEIEVVRNHLAHIPDPAKRSLYRHLGYSLATTLESIEPENADYKEIAKLLSGADLS